MTLGPQCPPILPIPWSQVGFLGVFWEPLPGRQQEGRLEAGGAGGWAPGSTPCPRSAGLLMCQG